MRFTLNLRFFLTAAFAFVLATPAFSAERFDGETATFAANYRLSKIGVQMLNFDYNRITEPGTVLTVRIPGIYADVANTHQAIVSTEIENGAARQQRGFLTSLSKTTQARELKQGETVYVTKLDVNPKKGIVHFELITTELSVLAFGASTRYRSEVNFHIENLSGLKAEETKAIIDNTIAEASIANAVQSKTVDIGMSTEQVKQALGNPDKIVNLGPKTIFVYKDMKVVFIDSKVTDVQ